jgi:hypothetical protein
MSGRIAGASHDRDPPNKYPQAEAQFKKAQRATEGAKAMSEYIAERAAERAKTARLKELRLAKEAADKEAKTKPGKRVGVKRVVRNVKIKD